MHYSIGGYVGFTGIHGLVVPEPPNNIAMIIKRSSKAVKIRTAQNLLS